MVYEHQANGTFRADPGHMPGMAKVGISDSPAGALAHLLAIALYDTAAYNKQSALRLIKEYAEREEN